MITKVREIVSPSPGASVLPLFSIPVLLLRFQTPYCLSGPLHVTPALPCAQQLPPSQSLLCSQEDLPKAQSDHATALPKPSVTP